MNIKEIAIEGAAGSPMTEAEFSSKDIKESKI